MTVLFFLGSIIKRVLYDLYSPYSLSEAILKLSQSVRGYFVTIIEVGMRLITCEPGHTVSAFLDHVLQKASELVEATTKH